MIIILVFTVIWPYFLIGNLAGIVVFIPLMVLRLMVSPGGQVGLARDMPTWTCLMGGLPPSTIERCNEKPCLTALDVYGKFIGNAASLPNPGEDFLEVAEGLNWTHLDCANMCNQSEKCRAYGYLPKVGACHLYKRDWNYFLDVPQMDRLLFADYLIGYKNKGMEDGSKIGDHAAGGSRWRDVSTSGAVELSNEDEGREGRFIFPTFEVPEEYYCRKMANELTAAYGYQYDVDHRTCQIFDRATYEAYRGAAYKNIKVQIGGAGQKP